MKLKTYTALILDWGQRTYTRNRYGQKIAELLKKIDCTELNAFEKKQVQTYFSQYGFKKVNLNWHRFFKSANGVFHANYIPEDLYYTYIEPALNRIDQFQGCLDKNLLDLFFTDVRIPQTILKNRNGFFYDEKNNFISKTEAIHYCKGHGKFVIKPTLDSGCGKNVMLLKNPEGSPVDFEALFREYKKDFIIQEFIQQHDRLKLLNESSLNTYRIVTYMNHDGVHVLSHLVRVGGKGEFADNAGKGTIGCFADKEGVIKFGHDYKGKKFKKTEFGCVLRDFKVPEFANVLSLATSLHKQMPYYKLISWDFTVDTKGQMILLEFNGKWQGINEHQINNQQPLFGKFTDEILNETKTYWANKYNVRSSTNP